MVENSNKSKRNNLPLAENAKFGLRTQVTCQNFMLLQWMVIFCIFIFVDYSSYN